MLGLLRRMTLERAVQLALAATIVSTVVAAGSILGWMEPARKVRWAALFVLVGLALVYARRYGDRSFSRASYLAAGSFAVVALVSAAWSSEPRLTAGRAIAFSLVLLAAAAFSHGAAGRDRPDALLEGVLLGAVAVAVAGLLVLAFRYDRAVQAATTVSPARYQGLGGGPNLAAMVLAVATPLAFHVSVAARSRVGRVGGLVALALLLGSVAFSGSRGALAAAAAGLVLYAVAAARTRRRHLLLVAAALLIAVTLGVSRLPSPAATNPPDPTGQDPAPAQVTPAPGYLDANLEGLRLQDDIGHPGAGVPDPNRRERNLFGTSGRSEAWRGALALAADRPLVGYGFGTEDRTFVDRYVFFNSNVPENSYLGLLLQLGVAGLALLAALVVALLRPALHAVRGGGRGAAVAAAASGAFAAALVVAVFQSYLYAAGSSATAAAWTCAFAASVSAARS